MTAERERSERVDGLVFVLSVVAVAVVLGAIAGLPLAPLRLPAGLLVGLFAPGYLLLRATVGDRLRGAMRFVLAVPLTLGMAAVTGVALDATPPGVRSDALGVALCVASLVLVPIALVRGTAPALPRPSFVRASSARGSDVGGRPPRQLLPIVLLAVAFVLGLTAVGLRVADSVDSSVDPDAPIVLTGRVASAVETGRSSARARIALTLTNNALTPVKPALAVAVSPQRKGTSGARRQRVPLGPQSTRIIRLTLRVACGGAVRARLSGAGVPRRAVTLRVTCPRP